MRVAASWTLAVLAGVALAAAHRLVFDRRASTVTLLLVGDAGVLLGEALRHVRNDLARRIPDDLPVRLAAVSGDAESTALGAVELDEGGPRAADRHPLRLRYAARRRHRPLARVEEPREGCQRGRRAVRRDGGAAAHADRLQRRRHARDLPLPRVLRGRRDAGGGGAGGRPPLPRDATGGGADPLGRDDTTATDTAAPIRASGLIREVDRGPAKPPWPTLRELVERDERVLVENDPGDEPYRVGSVDSLNGF
jgi:hypothetical protein